MAACEFLLLLLREIEQNLSQLLKRRLKLSVRISIITTKGDRAEFVSIIKETFKTTKGDRAEFVSIIKETFKTLSTDHSFIEFIVQNISSRVNELLDAIKDEYQSRIKELCSENKLLHKRIDHMEQYSRKNNIRIQGLKENSGEDIKQVFNKFLSENLMIDSMGVSIDNIHSIGKNKNEDTEKHRAVLEQKRRYGET
ncbi:hypothetical protein QE152_g38063 [Popillia japonica]|uniref:Uncharacterized protein n=1 Tax=Popillia japonica TaxID=7064 RepID=A0AAW1I8B5_POPJA